jgi:hypothetical protein
MICYTWTFQEIIFEGFRRNHPTYRNSDSLREDVDKWLPMYFFEKSLEGFPANHSTYRNLDLLGEDVFK